MILIRRRSMRTTAAVLAAASIFAACKNSSGSEGGGRSPLQRAESASGANAAQDPCTLLSSQEAEPYVGALAMAPFRASDGSDAPDVGGEACVYRGRDGRHLTVLADWRGGDTMGKVLEHLPKSVDGMTNGASAQGEDSMAGMVLPRSAAEPWDKVTWIAGGTLFVYKGDTQIRIDMSAAGGRMKDALAMAREIVPRIRHSRSYSRSK